MSTHPVKRAQRKILLLEITALLSFGAIVLLMLSSGEPLVIFGVSTGIDNVAALVATVVAAVSLFAVIFVSMRMHRQKLKGLAGFEDATRRLTNGDYSRRVNVSVRNEFQTLAKAFNKLTDQLEESLISSRSLADIDRLILSAANLETILQKVLLSGQMDAVEVTLLLRGDMSSVQVSTYGLTQNRMEQNFVATFDVTDDHLKDIEGYRAIARRACGGDMLECIPIAEEDTITGVLVAAGHRSLSAGESKRLTDLVDRLSVAVTNIRRSESLYQQAHFDVLTGLLNRLAFEDKLRESLSRSERGEKGVLLFLDLDGFKKVNDTEGHEAGDRLLVAISERLRETLRPEDTIARLGGDEFAIIVPGCENDKSVPVLCERIISSVIQPIVVDRMEHLVGTSIGVALYPDDGRALDELVMKADSAMYRAKEAGGSRFAFFDDTLNEANRHRVLVETRLRSAIENNELQVHFQPKLNLKTWQVDSAEALLRWNDKKLGEVKPDMFVSIAEETSLVQDFMPIVVDRAALLIAAVQRAGTTLETVAVNASPKQLMAEGFALSLLSMLDRRRLPHHFIELEVTESVFARDTEQVVRELEILRDAGIKIALDDFGTGYSSLNMLRELPLDTVKIDRAFITELDSTAQARMLLGHIISIAGTLGMKVVAEGVETDLQFEHLLATDCHYVQGFLISQARSEREFVNALPTWQAEARNRRSHVGLSMSQGNRLRRLAR
jgi:diguanylate cyclase (GGDEF)-like protein